MRKRKCPETPAYLGLRFRHDGSQAKILRRSSRFVPAADFFNAIDPKAAISWPKAPPQKRKRLDLALRFITIR